MLGSGPRHRRAQSSLTVTPAVEIVISQPSPLSDTFPLSPYRPLSFARLQPPPVNAYGQIATEEENERRDTSTPSISRWWTSFSWKGWLIIVFTGVAVFSLLQHASDKYTTYRLEQQLMREVEEVERNIVRREIAAKLFPQTTFHPSPLAASPSPNPRTSDSTIDRGYLYPVRIAEQESKGQQHLHQLALLAVSLDRTLVLPNVGGSRLHACQPFPFEFHYDVEEWLNKFQGKLRVIGQEDWLKQTEEDQRTYRTRALKLAEGKKVHAGELEDTTPIDLRLSDFCLARSASSFDVLDNSLDVLYAPTHYREFDDIDRAGFSNRLVSFLARSFPTESTSEKIDLLIVDYDLRYPIFPNFIPNTTDLTPLVYGANDSTNATSPSEPRDFEPEQLQIASFDPFPSLHPLTSTLESPASNYRQRHPFLPFSAMPYSPLWVSIASNLAKEIEPAVGVHWRMETVPPQHLPACSNSLEKLLNSDDLSRSLIEEEEEGGEESTKIKTTTIYLASDYPLDRLLLSQSPTTTYKSSSSYLALSDTFNHLTSAHHAAANRLISLLSQPPRSHFLTYFYPSYWIGTNSPQRQRRSNRKIVTLTTLLSSSSTSTTNNPPILPQHLSTLLSRITPSSDHHPDLFSLDSGLKGILDKLVLQRTDQFIAGYPITTNGERYRGRGSDRGNANHGVEKKLRRDKKKKKSSDDGSCAKGSSFTESIIEGRKLRIERSRGVREMEGDEVNDRDWEDDDGNDGDPNDWDKDIVRWFRRPV